MKDLIISLIIIISVFSLSNISQKYLIRSGNEIVIELKSFKNEIEKNNVLNLNKINLTKNKWNGIQKIWKIVSNHENIDIINLDFFNLISHYKNNEKKESLEKIDEIIYLIEQAPEIEKISLENVF